MGGSKIWQRGQSDHMQCHFAITLKFAELSNKAELFAACFYGKEL